MLVNSIKTKNNFHNYIVIKQSDNTSAIEILLCGANGSILSDLNQSCTLTILDEVDGLIRQKTKEQIVNGTVMFRVANDLKTNPHTLEITTADGQKFPSNHDFKIFVSYTHDESELRVINNLSREEALAEIDQSVKRFITDNSPEFIDKAATAQWLAENEFKPKAEVATFSALPAEAELKEMRLVVDENKQYIYDGTQWIEFGAVNADGLTSFKSEVYDRMNGQINVKSFGVVGDGIVDDTANLQKAFNYAIANKLELFSPKIKCLTTDTLFVNDVMHLRGGLEIYCDHNKTGVIIAAPNEAKIVNDRTYPINVQLSITRKTFQTLDTAIGMEIVNCSFSKFELPQIKNHYVGLLVRASGNKGTSYNKFDLGRLSDCVNGIKLQDRTDGWVTENTFYNGSFGSDAAIDLDLLQQHVLIDGDKISHSNNNKFFSPSFEGRNPIAMEFRKTQTNYIYGARFEVPYATNLLIFDNASQSNSIEMQYGVNKFFNELKFTDYGRYNKVTGITSTAGNVYYYDLTFFEMLSKGKSSLVTSDNRYKRIAIGFKSIKIITPINGVISLKLNEADHFLIKNISVDITSIIFDNNMEIGEEKMITFLQGATGVNISGFPGLFLGKRCTAPANRAYGRDVYKFARATELNEVYALSQYSN
ncbi:hypothetical protein CW697_09405 [Macrococcoides caseolyticum]|uniref:hypothetical protein n=1 Tax=Macrococcoides caseolyticum TaxID=69966 RepID=UPI000C34EF61|nr:hypothetical protein [Macrococcus caseolyticus]PKE34627.1 hypothetical protein CW668_00055 [Macrococcus caseolyticus]PKF29183.1 hypothetical protein CW697_09405 [Macrococcus caseolyticus]